MCDDGDIAYEALAHVIMSARLTICMERQETFSRKQRPRDIEGLRIEAMNRGKPWKKRATAPKAI
jgi:hypothetical protein